MLDHLDDCGRVIAGQALVAVEDGAVAQGQPLAFGLWHAVELEPLLGRFEQPVGDLHADNLGELRILQQHAQQLAFAATEVQYTPGADRAQGGQHRAEAAIVQAFAPLRGVGGEPGFERLLPAVALFVLLDQRRFVGNELLQRGVGEVPAVLQVAKTISSFSG